VKEAIERVIEKSDNLVNQITPFPRKQLASNAAWDANLFEVYSRKETFKVPSSIEGVKKKKKSTWEAKSKRTSRRPGERGWFRTTISGCDNIAREIQQRWKHPNPLIESRPREPYDDYFSEESSSESDSEFEEIFVHEKKGQQATGGGPHDINQTFPDSTMKKKKVIPKIWKGRELSIQKFGHDEKRAWRDKIGEFLRKSRKTLGHRPLDTSWGGSVLDSVIGANLTQNVTDVLSSTAMLNLMAKFPVTEETRKAHLERFECSVRTKALVKNAIASIIEKGNVQYELDCAKATRELVQNAITRIISGASNADVEMEDVGGEEDEDENDGESIEYIEIDDDESTYQPLDLLCRGVPKIESSSFDAEARNFFNSMNDDGDRKIIKDSTVLFERQSNTMTALEKLYFEERRMWDNFAKKPLTKKRFSEKEAWIECSNENCGKWRRVPKGMSNALLVHGKTLNEHSAEVEYLNWTCSRSFDNRYNSCEKVQEMENDDIDELVRDAEKMRIDDEEKRANDKKMREKKEKLRVEREVLKQQATTRVELNRREKRANTEKLKALAQDARDRPDFLFDEITTSDDIIVHDSVDWYRVLHEATTDEIVECIRCRGMHFMLAERIKKILKRVLDERGVLSPSIN
jgi:endonuclease III